MFAFRALGPSPHLLSSWVPTSTKPLKPLSGLEAVPGEHRFPRGLHQGRGDPPRGSAFKQTPGLKECLPLRPCGLEPRQRAEVAPVDGTPVPAAPCGQGLPGAGGQGAVCHVRGAVPPAFAPWRGRAARPSGHLEIRSVEHTPPHPQAPSPGRQGRS